MLTAVDNDSLTSTRGVDPHAAPSEAVPAKDTVVCVGRFKVAVDEMLVQVEQYRKSWLTQLELQSLELEKDLEAQSDLLDVSAGQLEACVALGRTAVSGGDDGRVCEAAQAAKAMEGLLAVPTRPCTGKRSAVLCDLSAALTSLEEGTRLQQFEVDAARSSVTGNGLTVYANDGVARNVIRVACMDSDGELADWATLADADVGMTVNGATWQVASAVLTEPGVVEVMYVVEEGGAEEMEVGVSLRGVAVPGGPWHPRAGFMAKGVHIATQSIGKRGFNKGLAVSSDGSLMVTCNPRTHQLSVYRTEDGSHVRSFGGLGMGPGEFSLPHGLCMTARDTVLVAETNNSRIQEVTLEGAHVQFIETDDCPFDVAVHGDVVAVVPSGNCIVLYSYTTGALLREFPNEDDRMLGCACFSPDGKHLAVAMHGSITLMSVDGQSVRDIVSPWKVWRAVAFTCTGDVWGISRKNVSCVFSATNGMWLRGDVDSGLETESESVDDDEGTDDDGGADDDEGADDDQGADDCEGTDDDQGADDCEVDHVLAATVSGNRLYVLDYGRVRVYQ